VVQSDNATEPCRDKRLCSQVVICYRERFPGAAAAAQVPFPPPAPGVSSGLR
jgi:hypothetical protein